MKTTDNNDQEKSQSRPNTIALNKRARHEYFIEDEIEAGLELQGWEVKSMRAGKANISDSYIILKRWSLFIWCNHSTIALASTPRVCDPTRYA